MHRVDGGEGDDGTWQWTNESYPADAVSLRSISSDNFVVVDTTRGADIIGETSFSSGPSTLHEKAIYLLEGGLYQVEKLDFEGRKAYVRQIDCDYYTDAITYTKVTVLETFAAGPQTGIRAVGRSTVKTRPVGSALARRGPRLVARRRLQEDQVLHERERRIGRARSARTADAHHRVLADDSTLGDGRTAVRRRRSSRRRRRPVVRDAAGGAAAADVRSAGHRHLDRQRRTGRRSRPDASGRGRSASARRSPTSRESSSTTTIPAGSASASRCSPCTTNCWRARAN